MKLGRYETLVRLGRGGMAEVFAARLSGEAGFAKWVAIKRMLPHLTDEPALVARFLDEARLAALITSPHVVQTLDVGRSDDGEPFIVLELVLGVSLAHLLAERPLPSRAVRLELCVQAALGLADVHEARAPDGSPLEIVHRDVSPQNILVGVDGRARLADFGIARANLPREETRTGVVLGKLGYMSPEQLASGPLDARSDVYAMGCVAWEALTGRRLAAKLPERMTERITGGAAPAIEPDALPAPLAAVIARALSHDPGDRFADGRELAEALRDAGRALSPVPRKSLIDEVRRAAGPSLVELEEALADLGEGNRTRTLSFHGPTISALLGVAPDRGVDTAALEPEPSTTVDPPDRGVDTAALEPEPSTTVDPPDRGVQTAALEPEPSTAVDAPEPSTMRDPPRERLGAPSGDRPSRIGATDAMQRSPLRSWALVAIGTLALGAGVGMIFASEPRPAAPPPVTPHPVAIPPSAAIRSAGIEPGPSEAAAIQGATGQAADPATTQAAAIEPAANDSAAIQPAAIELGAVEPAANGPAGIEPAARRAEATDPAATESLAIEAAGAAPAEAAPIEPARAEAARTDRRRDRPPAARPRRGAPAPDRPRVLLGADRFDQESR